ncbi:MATE family efflux transporter [Aestuariicoccus sp. MJ-SS9]|uniref:MATE family efflux transporter n=1 Tax=Aestuariicoccus sp. MJ-SS9 TaxID=3079855 RepID=UPI00290EE22C|nr:MATE family efflux transporter [Aestuariicoccus sp. MJ-SS9]MDU8912018.1 MATE family efflux transporter [Aestuariicoccus sp. MJ-SS9]
MTTHAMTYRQHLRAILGLGLPLIGGHLAQFAIGLTDTVMIGWYGVPELAALTLAATLFFTLFLVGSGFAWAVMPMVANFAARGEETQIRRATRMALWLSIAYFALSMPALWFADPILRALGQTEQIAADAQTYLRIAGWGMLPALFVMVLKNYLAALEFTRVAFWVTVVAALANGLGNYALIFGNWGAPELGLRGAAIASIVTQVLSVLGMLGYALWRLPEHTLLRRFWNPDTEMLARVFALGVPIGLTSLAEVGMFAATAVMMGWLGTVPLAAHGIALQISSATFMAHLGLANVATVRAGNALGRGDGDHLRRGAAVALAASGAVVAATILLFLGAPAWLMGLFVDPADPARDAIVAAGVTFLAVAALFQLVDAAQVVTLGLLRGLQDTRVPMLIAALAYWGLGLPGAYVFGLTLGYGGPGIWFGLVLGLGVAAVLLLTRFQRHSRVAIPAATGS